MTDKPTLQDLEKVVELTDHNVMPFGLHKNKRLGDVPTQYLEWLSTETNLKKTNPALYDYCIERLEEYEPQFCSFCYRPEEFCKC